MKKLLYAILFIIPLGLVAQFDSTDFKKAQEYYELNNAPDCIEALNRYLAQEPAHPEAYKMRGNCFLMLEDLAKAEADYFKALAIDSTYGDALFNLGHLYETKGSLDSAAYFFKQYTELFPEDPNALVRLASINRQVIGSESSLALLERAYAIDSNEAASIFYLAQEYFLEGDTTQCLRLLQRGEQLFPGDLDFLQYFSMVLYIKGDFEASAQKALQALQVDSTNFYSYQLQLQALMAHRAPSESLKKDNQGQYKFHPYPSFSVDSLAEAYKPKYKPLLKQIKAGKVLGLTDYFQFYLAQAGQKGYSPYGLSENMDIKNAWENQDFEALSRLNDKIWEQNPLHLPSVFKVAIAYYELGDYQNFKKYYALYFGLVESIIASGDGLDYDRAFVVISTGDQYVVMRFLELQSQQQSLLHEAGHSFDQHKIPLANGESLDLLFNIDLPFSSLSKQFDD